MHQNICEALLQPIVPQFLIVVMRDIICTALSRPPQPTLLDHHIDWLQS